MLKLMLMLQGVLRLMLRANAKNSVNVYIKGFAKGDANGKI